MATKSEVEIEDDKKLGVVEYLQAPKKKRRNFILLVLGRNFDKDLATSLEIWLKQNFKNYSVITPKSEKELKRLFSRQLVTVIIDDQFAGDQTLEVIKSLKSKKNQQAVGVLFLTKKAQDLIAQYNKELLVYQEGDNYLEYENAPLSQIYATMRMAVMQPTMRKSRRFIAEIPVKFFHLTQNQSYQGKLVNMSLHGAVLENRGGQAFKVNDQIQIDFPINQVLSGYSSDFIKLSAKVKRVFMGGDEAAICWLYISDKKYVELTKIILAMVNKQISRYNQQRKIYQLNTEKRT